MQTTLFYSLTFTDKLDDTADDVRNSNAEYRDIAVVLSWILLDIYFKITFSTCFLILVPLVLFRIKIKVTTATLKEHLTLGTFSQHFDDVSLRFFTQLIALKVKSAQCLERKISA